MDKNIRERLLKNYFSDEQELAEMAIERIEKKNPFAFKREKTVHGKDVDEKVFFGDILRMVKFLGELKIQGYTRLVQKWYGYEVNGFVAEKDEDETDEEMFGRFYRMIDEEIDILEYEIEKADKKKAKIAALEKELKALKSGL